MSSSSISELLEHRQELANTITHGVGFLISLVAVPILLAIGVKDSTWYQILGLSIFSFSLLAMYASSTVYHAVRTPSIKFIFQQIDHICIYLLIAGTNTPVVLYFMNTRGGYIYLAILWSMVLLGTLYKIFFLGKLPLLSLAIYIIMGWMGIIIMYFTWSTMPWMTIAGLLGGGFFYTFGVLFFQWEKLPYNHAYWHLCVIGGTIGHYLAVLGMV